MSPWRAVPAEPTDEMLLAVPTSEYAYQEYCALVEAAPAFEPTPAMKQRAIEAFYDPAHKTSDQRMCAALVAAFKQE